MARPASYNDDEVRGSFRFQWRKGATRLARGEAASRETLLEAKHTNCPLGRRKKMKTWFGFGSILAGLIVMVALATGAGALEQASIPFQRGDPVLNGCAAGWEAIQLSDFPPQYRAPARIDDPANGGNGDGIVCAKPWNPAEQAVRLPGEDTLIFSFTDNTLTPAH